MNDNITENELIDYIECVAKANAAGLPQGTNGEEIDHATGKIMGYTNAVKCRCQMLKGQICRIMFEGSDFAAILHGVRAAAEETVRLSRRLSYKELGGDVEIGSQSIEEAIATAQEEIRKLHGMRDVLAGYAAQVVAHCDIFLKAVFGEMPCAMTLPDPMIGKRNGDGSWDLDACRCRFQDLMLFVMDSYDQQSMPFRAMGSTTSHLIEEADFGDVVIKRESYLQMLREIYDLEESAAPLVHLREDNTAFVQSAKQFLHWTEQIAPPLARQILFGAYGLTDGSPKTLEELSEQFDVTREFARQVIAHEGRRLQSTANRSRILGLAKDEK